MPTRAILTLAGIFLLLSGAMALTGGRAMAVQIESPDATQDTPLLFDPDSTVMSMATANGMMFWSTYDGCPGGEFPVTCRVREKPLYGTFRTTIFDNSAGPRSNDIKSNIAADGEFVYWLNDNGQVVKKSRYTPAATAPTFVAAKETPGSFGQVAVDDEYVYWTENIGDTGRVFRAPKVVASGRQLMASSTDDPLGKLSADGQGGVLYVADINAIICCVDVLHHVTPNGAGGFHIDRGGAQVQSYAITDDRAYWATNFTSGGVLSLRSAPLSNLLSEMTVYTRPDSAGNPEWPSLAVDDTHAFWHEFRRASSTGSLSRLELAGGSPENIVTSLPQASYLTGDNRTLYWLHGGQIYSLPKSATALTLDLSANELGLEVVQVIQSQAHDVPLVTDKPTFVRVYGRMAANNQGLTQIPVWPPVVLYGSSAGVSLPGSPLQPLQLTPPSSAPVDRTTLTGNYLFQLPPEWISRGSLTLRAEINPRRTVVETDYTNNVTERTVTLRSVQGICLDILPVLTTAGPSGNGDRAHNMRAKALLPLSELWHVFRGGPLRTTPVLGEPYNLFEDDDPGWLMYNLMNEFMFSSPPSHCLGRRTIRAVIVPAAARFGISSGMAPIIAFLESYGGSDVNWPDGGVMGLAHELGHQFGRAHVGCPTSGPGAPDGPDGGYPYPPCQLDSSNIHIGFDSITKRLVVPLDSAGNALFSDVMSYSNMQQWTSDYTYRNIFGAVREPLTARAPLSTRVREDTQLLIGGTISGSGRTAIEAGYEVSGETLTEIEAKLGESTIPAEEYELRRYGTGNTLIGTSSVLITQFDVENGADLLAFFSLVPADASLARVELVRAGQGVIAGRAAGTNPPSVTITQPGPGTSHSGALVIRWRGSDPDGDPLMYQVRYSNDNGANWMALTGATAATSMTVDLASLPGGTENLVEVTVSDGLHSATTASGLFQTPMHAPQATIMSESLEELSAGYFFSMNQSGSVQFMGSAYDVEDGVLTDSALQWQLSGPVTVTAEGEELLLRELPPGLYNVRLVATDRDNQTGTAETRLMVAPKHVADGPAVILDGFCDDQAYTAEQDPVTLRYSNNEIAQAVFVRTGGGLYACFSGLRINHNPAEAVAIKVDVENDGSPVQDADDLLFVVRSDGRLATGRGNGGTDFIDAVPEGFTAAISHGSLTWQAELRIDTSRLGSWNKLVRLHVAHKFDGSLLTFASWPDNSAYFSPATWGLTALGRLNQSITFGPLVDRRLNELPFTVSATTSSGLPVRFASATPAVCTVRGSTVSLIGTGSCTLTAAQSGTVSYAPASVSRTFTVQAAEHNLLLPQIRR